MFFFPTPYSKYYCLLFATIAFAASLLPWRSDKQLTIAFRLLSRVFSRDIDDCFCCSDRVMNNYFVTIIAFTADPCGFCRESFAVIAWRTTNNCFCSGSLPASVVSLLRWSSDEQLTIAIAAHPCGLCRESFAVIAWRTTNNCFCCGSLRLLSWVFSGDRVTNNQRLLLLRLHSVSAVSLLWWLPDEQPMLNFAVNPCGFCHESFAVIAQDEQPTIAFAANPCGFCHESFAVIIQDKQPTIAFAADPCAFCRESFAVIAWRTIDDCFCCEFLQLLSRVFCGDRPGRTTNDCFCCESLRLLLRAFCGDRPGRTTNDCFCCGSLQLLSWVFCGDHSGRTTNDCFKNKGTTHMLQP